MGWRSRNRLAADWFAKLRQNAATQEVEHTDVVDIDVSSQVATKADVAYVDNALSNIDMSTKADISYVDNALANVDTNFVNAYYRQFNTRHGYSGNGVHLAAYQWTISGLTPGNKLILHVQLFGESHHDCNIRMKKDSTWLMYGSGGGQTNHPPGIYTPTYDHNEDSTPNLGSFITVADITATSHTFRIYRYSNSGSWYVNRCYNNSYEVGVTTQIAYEVKP